MSDLTPRQTQILRLIQRFISDTGMPPTRAEIAHELGFRSANAAEEHLRALARKGVIALVPGTSRGIQLKDTMREQIGLPLIGRVAAGKPIFAEENFEARLQIDPGLFQPRPHYLLKVTGMSMKDAGILDGDLVAVHRTAEVRSRQIVVARLENEVTVKRYRQEGSIVWLLPENPEFEPIRVDLKEEPLLIEGIVVGVVRRGRASGLRSGERRVGEECRSRGSPEFRRCGVQMCVVPFWRRLPGWGAAHGERGPCESQPPGRLDRVDVARDPRVRADPGRSERRAAAHRGHRGGCGAPGPRERLDVNSRALHATHGIPRGLDLFAHDPSWIGKPSSLVCSSIRPSGAAAALRTRRGSPADLRLWMRTCRVMAGRAPV